jgi:hypothetical protein
MHNSRNLLLHDILFALEIQRDLVYVVLLLKFEFTLNIYSTSIKLHLDDVCYGYGYIWNNFNILNVINIIISSITHFSLITLVK